MNLKIIIFSLLFCLLSSFSITAGNDFNTVKAQQKFEAKNVFPGWNEAEHAGKVLGKNRGGKSALEQENDGMGALMLFGKVIDIILAVISPLVVVMAIWSGILFITAGSDEEAVSKAKRFFTYAIMGFIFILISFALVRITVRLLT